MHDLTALGLTEHFEHLFSTLSALEPRLEPMRVATRLNDRYRLLSARGEHAGVVAGRCRDSPPATGDWVAVEPPAQGELWPIRHLLPRRTALLRQTAGGVSDAQVIAANMEVVLVVAPLDRELNPAGIHRYLTAVAASGARAAVVLNKADLCEDLPSALDRVGDLATGVPLFPVSALSGDGIDAVRALLRAEGGAALTAALVGPSGVGKSTLVNRLAGRDAMAVGEVRSDAKGRHTTTRRELVRIPGAVIIDTPGMRELALWADGDAAPHGGEIIEALAGGCRFRDCTHDTEPGCAVLDAVERGELSADLLAQVRKQERELQWQLDRQEARRRRQARGKEIAKLNRRSRRDG